MRAIVLVSVLMTCAVCHAGQNPTPPASSSSSGEKSVAVAGKTGTVEAPIFKSEGDFTFSYPADWDVVDMKPMLPVQRLKAEQNAKSEMEKKGASCADVQLTIRHGNPASVVLIMFLEYKCLGLELNESDLGSTGLGIATGLTKSFSVKDPKYGAYTLGKHAFWIERADGTPLNHPEHQYKLETTCTMLKKGLVCWLAMAGSPDAISVFEASNVSLEGDSPVALVPASAFEISK